MQLLKFADIPVQGNPLGLTALKKITAEQTFPDQLNGLIESPEVKSYPLIPAANFGLRVKGLVLKTGAGTVTVALQINGTSILFGKFDAIEVGTGFRTVLCDQAVRVGDRVELEVNDASEAAADLEFTLGLEK